MVYDQIFDQAIDRLHEEGRYRVFIDILRNKGAYPNARCFHGHNGPKPITVWCSNDYLCMGQHEKVIGAMEAALHDVGAGSGGTGSTSRIGRSRSKAISSPGNRPSSQTIPITLRGPSGAITTVPAGAWTPSGSR